LCSEIKPGSAVPSLNISSSSATVKQSSSTVSQPQDNSIEINSNVLDFEDETKFVLAKGSVTIAWEDKFCKADEVRYWVDKEYMIAQGHVVFTQNGNVIFAKSMVYDMKNKVGDINQTSAYVKPWYFNAEYGKKLPGDEIFINKAELTTCDLATPHYVIRTTKTRIWPGERIVFYNPVFYFRGIPFFYLPIFGQGLGKHKHEFKIEPGFNSEDGFILKTMYGYPISKYTYIRLFLDIYTQRGVGTGAEYDYDVPGKIKGTFYGYHIKDELLGTERWTANAAHWQKLGYNWIVQGQMSFESDTNFNNNYYLENWNRTNSQIFSNLSFSKTTKDSTIRITTQRTDTFNPNTTSYQMTSLTIPRIEYTAFPKKSIFGIYQSFTGSFENIYVNDLDTTTSSGSTNAWDGTGDYNLKKNINIGRKVVVTPALGVREYWFQRSTTSVESVANNFLYSEYYSNLNMRIRASRWLDLNFLHSYALRSKLNSLEIDSDANDYGQETNTLTYSDVVYLSRKMIMRNSTSYNFQNVRVDNIDDWKLRFTPITNELVWQPAFLYTLYLREQSNFYPNSLQTAQAYFSYGDPTNIYASFGTFYNYVNDKDIDINLSFGFWPTKKWKIDYTISTTAVDSFRSYRTNNQEIRIYRDLHCWDMKLTYDRRTLIENGVDTEVDEIKWLLSIKGSTGTFYNKAHEQEFYPFRTQ
jgi:LPS-assembly protein